MGWWLMCPQLLPSPLLLMLLLPVMPWYIVVMAADIVKEVAIMRLLSDHPNTVQLHQVHRRWLRLRVCRP